MAVISVKKGTRRRQQSFGFRRTDREVLKQTAAQDQDPPSLLHYSRVPVERGGQAGMAGKSGSGSDGRTAKEGPSVDSATPYGN